MAMVRGAKSGKARKEGPNWRQGDQELDPAVYEREGGVSSFIVEMTTESGGRLVTGAPLARSG